MATSMHSLQPYKLQVGGHSTTDGVPASLVDDHGHFLKKLQVGERGEREAAFYRSMEQHRQQQQQQQQEAAGDCSSSANESIHQPAHQLLQQLAAWIPKSYGVRDIDGVQYLVMEDVTAAYKLPCILDVKIGYRTWYPWAPDTLQDKYRSKDAGTTQSSLGFRVCGGTGVQHNTPETGSITSWRVDRHWGKQLTPDTASQAFTRFADNGHLALSDLLQGPGQLLDQLSVLARIFEQQESWHFFSASLLVVYEGAAQTADDMQLQVKLIDFAHTFPVVPTVHGGAAGHGPNGRDNNFLDGLNSLIHFLQHLLDMEQQ